MRSFLSFFWKSFLLFTLWAFIGACLYSVGSQLFARNGSFSVPFLSGNSESKIVLPAIGERLLEAGAVRYAATARPADLDFDAEGSGYILEESGFVYRVDAEGVRDSVAYAVLRNDKTEKVVPFKGLAIHPGFLDPESRGFGRFYTIEPEKAGVGRPDFRPQFGEGEHHQDILCEYRTLDPKARVFTGSRREMLRLSQPGPEHNMSDVTFDRLGRLFIAVGDGAKGDPGRDQPSRNAMALANVYGKILRIDPLGNNSANGKYGIPKRNPFTVIDGALQELWCYGLRDPRRIEFDSFRDWLSIIDVGQDDIEEVNISEHGGEHFGWDLCEGSYYYPPKGGEKPADGVRGPCVEFNQKNGRTVAGGFIYRGESFPSLRGKMVFADRSGRLMASRTDGKGSVERLLVGNQKALSDEQIQSVRPGPTGELFILTAKGSIFELRKHTTASKKPRKSRRPLLASISPF